MNEKNPDFEDDLYDDEEMVDEEELIRSRIHSKITPLIKIKRIAFWALYIMTFYFFTFRKSGYLQFLSVTGSERVSGISFFLGFLILVLSLLML